MEKYTYIFVIIIFVAIIPIALCLILKPMLKHNKILNGVVNYDTFMKKYVFSIPLKKEDFFTAALAVTIISYYITTGGKKSAKQLG